MFWFAGAAALAGAGQCKLGKIVELATTVSHLRPMVSAKINGTDVRFVVDSGAFYSMISPASAAALKLQTYPAPANFYVKGIGGAIRVNLVRVSNFELNGIALHDIEFIVGGNDDGGDSIGLLGRNLLQIADAEFDLSQGMVRLLVPQNCGDAVLAYWAHPGEAYSVIGIAEPHEDYLLGSRTSKAAHFKAPITGTAYVNGVEIRVAFDTGSWNSFLTVKAAARAGIKLDSPGVVPAGTSMGVGRSTVANYLAQVSSFKIGDEEIRNTRLRLGDTALPDGEDMLIGADFFLSHHIYVANSQHKLYFTYNGGPVFNLKTVAAALAEPAPAAPATAANGEVAAPNPAASATLAPANPGEAAADFARRGAAFASRQELDQALPALTRACELAPDNPDYFYQRGMIYWQSKQRNPALADFDRAIQLNPNHVSALIARSGLRIQTGDEAGAEADLDAAKVAAAKEDTVHFQIATGYGRLGLFAKAIEQYDLWIASHSQDVLLPAALDGRCRARALSGLDLQRALDDCNKALKYAVKSSPFYAAASNSRGLVWLRLGNYDRSIADYDASLKIAPRDAWSLYGRGIDKMRARRTSEGETDIAQAKAISAEIGDTFGKYGILP